MNAEVFVFVTLMENVVFIFINADFSDFLVYYFY